MTVDLSSFDAAEAAFYRAFEHGDYDAMAQIWDDAEDIILCASARSDVGGSQRRPAQLEDDSVRFGWNAIHPEASG